MLEDRSLQASLNIPICHRCEHVDWSKVGDLPCGADGTSFLVHCEHNHCPAGKFGNPAWPDGFTPPQLGHVIQVTVLPPAPLPFKAWPISAKYLSRYAIATDRGIGDVAERLIAANVVGRLAKWALSKLPGDCGCAARRDAWNARWPLNRHANGESFKADSKPV